MKPTIIVTTSWDDGHKSDLKLAKLLQKYQLAGTFYVAPHDHEFLASERLTDTDIQNLSRNFEIGAHTMTHPRLPQISAEQASQEIIASKEYLEAITSKPVTSFCYPGGEYRTSDVQAVRDAGFAYARTVSRFSFSNPSNRWLAPTSVHAYRHWSDAFKILKFAHAHPVKFWRWLLNWDELAIAMFDSLEGRGGVFHIWGHSWEIDRNNDWPRLERVLAHISNRPGVMYRSNRELS